MRRFLTTMAAAVMVLAGLVATPTAAQAASAVPTIVSPADGAQTTENPILRWNTASNANSYTVQVSSTSTFSVLAWTEMTRNTASTPTKDLATGIWYWRVRSTDPSGVNSEFSPVRTFEKTARTAPAPTYPKSDTGVASLVYPRDSYYFEWVGLPGSASYQVQTASDADFTTPTTATSITTRYSPASPPTFGTVLYWRVRAMSANNVYSEWSEPASFSMSWAATDAVTLVSPVSTTATPINEVVLDWNPKAGAAYYEVQVDRDDSFTAPDLVEQRAYGTQWSPNYSLDLGSYFWRVRAVSTNGQPGPYSTTWTFTRRWPALTDTDTNAQVTLVAPAEGAAVRDPQLTWAPQKGSSHYQVQIGADPNFSTGTFNTCLTNNTSLTPYRANSGACDIKLSPGTRYYWRVRAQDGPQVPAINGSLWSETRSFRWDLPSPTIIGPPSSLTLTSNPPILRWQAVEGITQYRVTLTGRSPKCISYTVNTYHTTYVPHKLSTTCDTGWNWDVQSVASTTTSATNGEVSPARLSQPYFAWIPTANPSATLATPTVSTAASERHPAALVQWNYVTGADKYEVYIGESGSNLYQLSGTTVTRAWAHTGFDGEISGSLRAGTYDVQIKAVTSSGSEVALSAPATFTVQPIAQTVQTGPANCPLTSCTALERETPTFTWNHVAGAAMYEVYLATDPNFANVTNVFYTKHRTLTPTQSLPDAQAGQATYWYVRPCAQSSNCGAFGSAQYPSAWAFRQQSVPVQTVSPVTGQKITSGEVNFDWTDYLVSNRAVGAHQTAAWYQVEVANNPAFTPVLETSPKLDQTRYTAATTTYPDGPLYWRVRAYDNSGNALRLSAAVQFSKAMAAPGLVAPASGTTQPVTPRLEWTADPYSAQYDVEVYKYPGTISPTNRVASLRTKTTVAVPSTILPPGEYQWRVRRIDAALNSGSWSDETATSPWRFRVAASAASLVSPANGSTQTTPQLVFTWAPVQGATRYTIQVSTSPTFSPLLKSTTTDMTSWAPTLINPAYPDGLIYWRVLALDKSGATVSTSTTWSFTRDRGTLGEFAAVKPYRVLDTRPGYPLKGGQSLNVRITGGSTGIPTTGVSAVVLNATAVNPTATSYLTIFPAGGTRPTVSSLNWVAGRTIANHVTVPVSSTGTVTLYNQKGDVDVLFDVVGYYSAGDLPRATRYTPAATSARISDTRSTSALRAGETRVFEVGGLGGVPTTAKSVVMNVTAVKPTKAGYLTVFPTGTARPTASSLNFPAGTVVPNLVTMPLGTNGTVSIYNPAGSTDVLLDVVGWYLAGDPAPGTRFTQVAPLRIADTRNLTSPNPVRAGTARAFQVTGKAGIPTGGVAKAAVLNVTVVKPWSAGWATVYPSGTSRPATSNLNFAAGQTVPNQVIATIGSDGNVMVYTSSTTDVLIDVVGWLG